MAAKQDRRCDKTFIRHTTYGHYRFICSSRVLGGSAYVVTIEELKTNELFTLSEADFNAMFAEIT